MSLAVAISHALRSLESKTHSGSTEDRSEFQTQWAVYVRRLDTPGLREYYVYFGESAELEKVLPSINALHPEYRIEFETRTDPQWTHYESWIQESEVHG